MPDRHSSLPEIVRAPLASVAESARATVRQAASLEHTAHRPWPLPSGPWVMGQSWVDLLFAHWPLEVDVLQPHVPLQLPLDTYDGRAWLAVTPFRLRHLRLRATLPFPPVSNFLELNVRTYVTVNGKPGVYFFSLDASSAVAVRAARRLYRLPYQHARMSAIDAPGGIEYSSRRGDRAAHRAEFKAFYGGEGEPALPAARSLEHFLTERYRLYTVSAGEVFAAEIHHPPWRLRPGRAEIELNTMAPPGLRLSGAGPLLHLAEAQDVVIWPLERLCSTRC